MGSRVKKPLSKYGTYASPEGRLATKGWTWSLGLPRFGWRLDPTGQEAHRTG